MIFTIKVSVAAGTPTVATPPMGALKALFQVQRDYPVLSVNRLPIQQIESEMEDICCRPLYLVEKQWGTPLNHPVNVQNAMFYRHANRYDWPNGNSFWMCVEIQ